MAHALVFDSGVGGLSVVKELRVIAPDLYLSYIADDEFRPYGDKTEAQLKSRLPGLLQTLCLMLDPDIIVLACNTASTTALAEIRNAVDVPVVGVVPAIKPAAEQSETKTIAVLGTPGTVRRRYVGRLISDFANGCDVRLHGSTKLVELAEYKLSGRQISTADVTTEIAPLFGGAPGKKLDTIVLACTHFPLLLDELAAVVPKHVRWIDSGDAVARRTLSILENVNSSKMPTLPQTAFSIGGQENAERTAVFKKFGFEKIVPLVA